MIEKQTCKWIEEIDSQYWECSECGAAFVFETDTPKENEYYYCPKCGRKIIEYIPWSAEESEGE